MAVKEPVTVFLLSVSKAKRDPEVVVSVVIYIVLGVLL